MKKIPGVRHVDYDYGRDPVRTKHYGDMDATVFLTMHVLKWTAIRHNARRGMVGEPPGTRDGRGVWSLPRFTELENAWDLLNAFANSADKEARALLFALLGDTCEWVRVDANPVEFAQSITSAVLTAALHLEKTRGYVL